MKNFHNCEPYRYQADLRRLIDEIIAVEEQRRITVQKRITKLQNALAEVTTFIEQNKDAS